MSDNLAKLIDHAITMSDELDLMFGLRYIKGEVRFLFNKNDNNIGLDFTTFEIEDITNIDCLIKNLTDSVYSFLDNINKE